MDDCKKVVPPATNDDHNDGKDTLRTRDADPECSVAGVFKCGGAAEEGDSVAAVGGYCVYDACACTKHVGTMVLAVYIACEVSDVAVGSLSDEFSHASMNHLVSRLVKVESEKTGECSRVRGFRVLCTLISSRRILMEMVVILLRRGSVRSGVALVVRLGRLILTIV